MSATAINYTMATLNAVWQDGKVKPSYVYEHLVDAGTLIIANWENQDLILINIKEMPEGMLEFL